MPHCSLWLSGRQLASLSTLVLSVLASHVVVAQPPSRDANPPSSTNAPATAADQPGADISQMDEQNMGTDVEARQHYLAGKEHFDAGRFTDAAREFEEAYRLSRYTELLYNSYIAWRDGDNKQRAAANLRLYLELNPTSPDAATLRARLAALDEAVAREARTEAERLEAENAARRASLSATRATQLAEEERARRLEAEARSPAGWIIMGGGAAIAVSGGVVAAIALGARTDIEDSCPDGVCAQKFDLEGRRKKLNRLNIAADALMFGGGAIAITGLVMALMRVFDGSTAAEGEHAPSVACGPTGCTVAGSF